jgi:hypothetical protein
MTATQSHEQHKTVIRTLVECAQECEHCGDACIEENRPHCARVCRDCAEICWTAGAFLSRGSTLASAVVDLCASACEQCAQECEQHDVDHCRACAEACRRCAEACRGMENTTPRTPAHERL